MLAVHWTIDTIGNKSLPWAAKLSVTAINFYIKPRLLVCKFLAKHRCEVASFSCWGHILTEIYERM